MFLIDYMPVNTLQLKYYEVKVHLIYLISRISQFGTQCTVYSYRNHMTKNYNSLPTDKIEITVYSLLLPEEKCQNSMLSAYCIHTVIKLKNIKWSHWKSSTIYTWFQNFWLVGLFVCFFLILFLFLIMSMGVGLCVGGCM